MLSTLVLALTLSSLKIEAPQIHAPKMQLDLPGVPKVEGLQGPSAESRDLTARQAEQSETMKLSPAKVEEVQLGRSFAATERGLRAVEPVDAFLVSSMPAQLPAVKACVRLASPDRMPARVKVQVKLPGGAELASAIRVVTFDKEWADVLFDLGSLKVGQAGSYSVVVSLDGAPVAEQTLEVRQVKQAAESSGR
jgi:hypothetical protein